MRTIKYAHGLDICKVNIVRTGRYSKRRDRVIIPGRTEHNRALVNFTRIHEMMVESLRMCRPDVPIDIEFDQDVAGRSDAVNHIQSMYAAAKGFSNRVDRVEWVTRTPIFLAHCVPDQIILWPCELDKTVLWPLRACGNSARIRTNTSEVIEFAEKTLKIPVELL